MAEMADGTKIVWILVCLTSTLGWMFCLALIVVNLKLRNHRLVKMSSPKLNIIMLLGAILLYTSNIIYGLTSFPSASLIGCQMWAWLLPLSFTLLFGCLFAKSWRVHRIFSSLKTKNIIKDDKLLCLIGALVATDVVIMVIWQLVDPIQSGGQYLHQTNTSLTSERTEIFTSTTTCRSHHAAIFSTVLLLYKSVYLMYGAYLAWAIRQVTIPPMDDSSCILIGSHVTVISTCLAVAAMMIFDRYPNVQFASSATAVWISTTVTVVMEFVPKLRYWAAHGNDDFSKLTLSPGLHATVSMATNIPSTPCLETSKCCDTNDNKLTQITVDQTSQTNTEIDLQIHEIQTPTRIATVAKQQDSPDSGHDSPRSLITQNYQMYEIDSKHHVVLTLSNSAPSPSSVGDSNYEQNSTMDAHRQRRQMYYDYLRRNKKLATAINETYDLDSDSDTLSYISHCMSTSQSIHSLGRRRPSGHGMWMLENDSYYPRQTASVHKRVRRKSRSQRNKRATREEIHSREKRVSLPEIV